MADSTSNHPFIDTDEDFFYKLVDDHVSCSKEESCVVDDNGLNDAKAFGKLSISDLGEVGNKQEFDNNGHLVSSSSITAGVKEVQWSDFGSGFVDNGSDAFGSYSGFFDDFGNGSIHHIGTEDNFFSSKLNGLGNSSLDVEDVNRYTDQLQFHQAYATYQKSEASYVQQSVVGAATDKGTTESITSLNSVYLSGDYKESSSNGDQGSEDTNKVYPSHMLFDPEYPGWYYDTNVNEWYRLDDYNLQSTSGSHDLVNQNGFDTSNAYYGNDWKTYSGQGQDYNYAGTTTMAQVNNGLPAVSGSQSFVPYSQPFTQPSEQSGSMNVQTAYRNQNQLSYLQQPVQSGNQVSTAGRSSADRPLHALVTFGFGGKLIVKKYSTSLINASYGGQDSDPGSISVLNLAEVITGGAGVHDYFHTICQQSFPGPPSGGHAGSKELNRWIDDRVAHYKTCDVDYYKGELLRLLLSLLKICAQHYGRLRSPLGSDTALKENDAPEVAVARLFASVKNSTEYNNYGAFAHCLQQVPSEVQTRETAAEVQTLLVSGKKKEALLRAQEGQLWGPALVLAAQLGDQFYVDTVKKMAFGQLVPGSPLRTICLLIAGQPADVFGANATTDGRIPDVVNMSQQQPTQAQLCVNGMLDEWEDNLAAITANRTKDDELVLMHLGDCLWKERSNIIAAHICYLVAEVNFEPYSDSVRLCLIGADHLKHPRTYASPEAIQRTEVYEYSKMLGNSQFTLLPFQPYKLIYAHMLAEVGRVSDSLKYCQAVTKSLKTGRIPQVEIWRRLVVSLEDRIKIHQQRGFSTNVGAPGKNKIVDKFLNLIDSAAHRVVGGLPPPVPSTSGGNDQNDHHQQAQRGPRVLTSQSTMAMSSLVPSVSMEPINQADGSNRHMTQNRSASEPDFGRSPMEDVMLKESSANSQRKESGRTSGLGGRISFGSIYENTLGRVLKSGQDKQAKLGDENKFYYDEKLQRLVEKGVDLSVEEPVLAPPPTTTTFQNGSPDYSLKTVLKTDSMIPEFASSIPATHTSGIPLIPATTNQFSARGRTGVQSRYVDTFNQGGGNQANLFQPPSVSSIKPATNPNPNPKFFVPTAAPAPPEQPPDNQTPLVSSRAGQSAITGKQKFASMSDISNEGASTSTSSVTNHTMSQRTLSWSGNMNQHFSVPVNSEQKPIGGMSRYTFTPNMTGFTNSSNDDLQEIEL